MLPQSYAQTFLASPSHTVTATGWEATGGAGKVWPLQGPEVTATSVLVGALKDHLYTQGGASLPVSLWEHNVSEECSSWAWRSGKGAGASACAAGPVHSSGFLEQEGNVESMYLPPFLLYVSPNLLILQLIVVLDKRMKSPKRAYCSHISS